MYPQPWQLFTSISRLNRPPLAPEKVEPLAVSFWEEWNEENLANADEENITPDMIEPFIYKTIPYSYDWETHNMPWYFPSMEEVLQNRRGDCKARYLVFASLLEHMDIPYQTKVSPTHIWVDYEGRDRPAHETNQVAFWVTDEHGNTQLQIPQVDLSRSWGSLFEGFWEVMPINRKILLLTGFPATINLPSLYRCLQNQTLPCFSASKFPEKPRDLT